MTASANTAIASGTLNDNDTGIVMQRFQVDSSNTDNGNVVLSSLTLDDTGNATSVASAKVYISTTSSATLPVGAVLIGSSAAPWNGTSTAITLNGGTAADRTVTNGTPKYIYIIYDMASGQAGNTVRSSVTAVGVASPDTGAGAVGTSNLITLQAGPVTLPSTITSCAGCHQYTPTFADGTARNVPAGQFPGSHKTHVQDNGSICSVCHVAPATETAADFAHRNGTVQMQASINGGTYSKGSFTQTNTFSGGTCFSVACHGNVYSTAGATTPNWGSAGTGCSTCHSVAIGATGPATGGHTNHAEPDCTLCHAAGTTSATAPSTGHGDGNIDVANTGYPANVTKHAAGSGYKTCTTASCHSNVYGVGSSVTPTWGVTGSGCGACHTAYPITASGPATGSHAAHATAGKVCVDCHNTGTTAATTPTTSHGDGDIDIPVGSYPANVAKHAAGSGYSSCSTAGCHGTATWGGPPMDCNSCHSVTMKKTLGSTAGAWGSIRQVVGAGGDFSRTNRHLRSATTFLKWDCIICHMEGWYTGQAGGVAGKTNSTYHNEGAGATGGKINLRNVDSPATGWAINNRAWGTTDYTNMDLFCLNCHDANGASGIAVNATNNGNEVGTNVSRRLKPFNTTDQITAGGRTVLNGSTVIKGGYREQVKNIKDQFYPGTNGAGATYNGNPSQHAVIGRRYSTVWPQWTQATWGSVYVLKKDGRRMNVARETATLSCADCHVIDAGSNGNAHSANTPYLMWTTAVKEMCWRCHNKAVYIASPSAGTSVAGSRIDHSAIDGGRGGGPYTAYGLAGGSGADWNCLMCHANWSGFTTATRVASYGGIHGSWNTTASWYTYNTGTGFGGGGRQAYRFTPGVAFIMGAPNGAASNAAWNSGGTFQCYFYDDATAMGYSNCNQHAPADGFDVQPPSAYRRPVAY